MESSNLANPEMQAERAQIEEANLNASIAVDDVQAQPDDLDEVRDSEGGLKVSSVRPELIKVLRLCAAGSTRRQERLAGWHRLLLSGPLSILATSLPITLSAGEDMYSVYIQIRRFAAVRAEKSH